MLLHLGGVLGRKGRWQREAHVAAHASRQGTDIDVGVRWQQFSGLSEGHVTHDQPHLGGNLEQPSHDGICLRVLKTHAPDRGIAARRPFGLLSIQKGIGTWCHGIQATGQTRGNLAWRRQDRLLRQGCLVDHRVQRARLRSQARQLGLPVIDARHRRLDGQHPIADESDQCGTKDQQTPLAQSHLGPLPTDLRRPGTQTLAQGGW
ncbi:hypothetical protein AMP9_3533 [plant metagenome]|uniref:Uncharacterized protein n=1 Tax=plant metagenome TaxID=1297885 RepID=A0A484NW47_9ZZZZ